MDEPNQQNQGKDSFFIKDKARFNNFIFPRHFFYSEVLWFRGNALQNLF